LNNYCQPSTPFENPPHGPAGGGLSGVQLVGNEFYDATPDRGILQLIESINGIVEVIQGTAKSPMPFSEWHAACEENDYDLPGAYSGM
jgi:hypothetical protein